MRDVGKNEGVVEDTWGGQDEYRRKLSGKAGNLERVGLGEGLRGEKRSWFWIGDDLRSL